MGAPPKSGEVEPMVDGVVDVDVEEIGENELLVMIGTVEELL